MTYLIVKKVISLVRPQNETYNVVFSYKDISETDKCGLAKILSLLLYRRIITLEL
jgi:hypothetical protein